MKCLLLAHKMQTLLKETFDKNRKVSLKADLKDLNINFKKFK